VVFNLRRAGARRVCIAFLVAGQEALYAVYLAMEHCADRTYAPGGGFSLFQGVELPGIARCNAFDAALRVYCNFTICGMSAV